MWRTCESENTCITWQNGRSNGLRFGFLKWSCIPFRATFLTCVWYFSKLRLFFLKFVTYKLVNLWVFKTIVNQDLVCGTAFGYSWTCFKPVSNYWASTVHSYRLMILWICSALRMIWQLGFCMDLAVGIRLYLFLFPTHFYPSLNPIHF